jgi:hypothetical protein
LKDILLKKSLGPKNFRLAKKCAEMLGRQPWEDDYIILLQIKHLFYLQIS